MSERRERARRAVADCLARFPGHDDVPVALDRVAGRIGDDPAQWAVVAGELLHSGLHDLSRPMLEAIAVLMRLALAETSPGHPDREQFVRYYGVALTAVASDHDDPAVLDDVITVLTNVVRDPRDSYATRYMAVYGLDAMAELRADLSPGAETAEALVLARKRLLEATHDQDPAKPEVMVRLGSALKTRYDIGGNDEDLAEALRVTRAAVLAKDDGVPPSWRTDLAALCRAEFARHRDPAVLDEEIRELRACLAELPDDGEASARVRAGLGNALRARYQLAGRPEDIELAVDLMRRAAPELSGDPSARATVLGNLSATLTLLYELTEDEDIRNESVRVGREATALGASGSAELLRGTNNLAVNQMRRYWQTGDSRALNEAIAGLEAALAMTPEPGPDRAGRLNNLGSALFMSFVRTGDHEPLDRSIALNREALAMLPAGHGLRPGVLNELGARLRQRYLRFDDVSAIEEAVEVLAESVSLTGPAEPDRVQFLTNHSAALHSLYRTTRDTATLDRAIEIARQTLAASPPGHASRASLLTACAATLGTKFFDTRDAAAGRESRAYFLAASQAPDAPARQVAAARQAANLSTTDNQWREAADALYHAVTLLPKVASRRLARSDQERQLADVAGMVRDAGACAVRAGSPERAVVALEQGRGILLAQALENRDDFATLRDRHPVLADELITCRDAMATVPAVGDQEHDRYHELAPRWDRLVARVRALPGFGRFLLPPRFDDLRTQAGAGPIVLVNVSEIRSDALVLTGDGLLVRELRDVTAAGVRQRVRTFLAAVDSTQATGAAHDQVLETLAWLWDAIAGPVLDLLGITGPPPAGRPWPRLWWCPTGPLAFLPLHAAGHHDKSGQPNPPTVIDRVVSSYTPTIRALEHARRPRSGDSDRCDVSTLAVAVPQAPNNRELPGALDELAVLRSRLPRPPEELIGRQACRDAVLARLPSHPWAHFACHAYSDLDDPSSGHLVVHDHETNPLAVGHISQLHLREAEFAYLSACSTGRTGLHLADEAIHLASAFQLAGYRQVVATLWPISDRHAVGLADRIYRGVAVDGLGSTAVHQATRRLRERWPDHPELWAAHIHAGA